MVMFDMYETRYGLHNHLAGSSKKRPLASVAFHPKEDYLHQSRLKAHMLRYLTDEVYQLTGMTFKEYLNQFPYEIEMQHETIDLYRKMLEEQKKKMKDSMEDKK